MVDFISRWSKTIAKIWLIGFLVITSILYLESINDSKTKYRWGTPVFADVNLFLPYSIQKSLNTKYIPGCITSTDFLF